MNKHTPGPWEPYQKLTRLKTWTIFDGKDGFQICSLSNSEIDETQDEPNARLIAAAPELLEACKLLLVEKNTPVDQGTMLTFGPAFNAATKAVAKAEGK